MRICIPNEFKNLITIFAPYIIYDKERGGYVLKEDAPDDAVKAKCEYEKWWFRIKR